MVGSGERGIRAQDLSTHESNPIRTGLDNKLTLV